MLTPQQATDATAPRDLEAFLTQRGCPPKLKQGLKMLPAPVGSGHTDTSINHDQILTDRTLES